MFKIDEMPDENIIEPARTEFVVFIVFVHKKDETFQIRVNYCKLNSVTKRDSYHILRMNDCIDSRREKTVFSTLDANSEQRQIEIEDDDKDKSAYSSHRGLYLNN